MEILTGLNPAQREAVEAIKGPVLIIAGPGSGKTRVITHRIAYLVKVVGVNPHRILAVTFTNKAAKELKERLAELVGDRAKELSVGTFHAVCARILRTDGAAIGIKPEFVIYDADDQLSLVKRAIAALGNIDSKQFTPNSILNHISAAKSTMITPAEYLERGRSYFEEVVQRVYAKYEKSLAECSALDFDDLLLKTVQLFQTNPEILAKYQSRYIHVQVDEFQDTNLVQYEFMKLISAKYRNVCVVGDPDQSIYSWRSADIRNILNFEKDFKDARIVKLEQNYRSTKNILDLATHVIAANKQRKQKDLWTENEAGVPTVVMETYTEQEEAQYVVNEIDAAMRKGEARPKDFAVMYRTNSQSRVLEEAFIRYGISYRLAAGTRFYERREIKDMLSYLRLISNPDDSVSLRRIINVPGRGIGDRAIEELGMYASSLGSSDYHALQLLGTVTESPLTPRARSVLAVFAEIMQGLVAMSKEAKLVDLLDETVTRSGYRKYLETQPDGDERLENIMELRTVAQDYNDLPPGQALSAFLEGVSLVSDLDSLETGSDAVTLITLHQAKGLEFPIVFIIGMEEGILPHYRSKDDPAQMEEERRLAYVGITRARRKLYLVRSFRRTLMGSTTMNPPSRFLEGIPPKLVTTKNQWAGATTPKAAEATWQRGPAPGSSTVVPTPVKTTTDLKGGDHVLHAQFGEGTVVSVRPVRDDIEVTIAFQGSVKRLLLSIAKIVKMK